MSTATAVKTDWNAMDDEAFRLDLRAYFEKEFPDELRFLPRRLRWAESEAWWKKLSKKGWLAPNWPAEYGGIRGLDLDAMGIPGQDEYLQHYYHHSGRSDGVSAFHFAFALFRLAVIFEGIAARAASGNAVAENAAQVGALAKAFARRGVEFIEAGATASSMREGKDGP